MTAAAARVTLTGLSWLSGPVTVPAARLDRPFFHQGPVGYPVDTCADPAPYDARYQRAGEVGTWYGSSKERGAWAEMFRHTSGGVSPVEIRRRVGRVTISATVVDLTDLDVRAALAVTARDLTGDDYTQCQEIAAAACASGLDGVLGPSAALPDCQTIAIFATAVTRGVLTAEHSRVQRAPVTVLDVLHLVRPLGHDAAATAAVFARLQRHRSRVWADRRRGR